MNNINVSRVSLTKGTILAFSLNPILSKRSVSGYSSMQKFKMRLNKFRAKFPYRSLLHYVCTFCSQETIVVTMDGFWGPLALFSWVKGFFFFKSMWSQITLGYNH